MSFLSNENIDEEERRNLAFQTLVAHRDLLQLAVKRKQPPTYENALGLLHELAPNLYDDFVELLTRRNDSELVLHFKELAEVKSSETGENIAPIELIEERISELKDLNEKDPTKQTIKRRLMEHLVARERMEPVRLTENRILNRDFNKADRSFYAEKYFEDDFFVDYKLANNDFLRIRFLHPDTDEHITGADLIYEQYDVLANKVRFVFLQYKTWESDVIYKSQATNMVPQIEKMTSLLCNRGLCQTSTGTRSSNKYRLPYCSGFLRPTDKIQDRDSKLMSSGYHVPLCNALRLIEDESKIEKRMIKEESFRSQIFEELFNSNMIGSRWIDVEALDQLYEEHNIFEKSDRIKLYAQEILE